LKNFFQDIQINDTQDYDYTIPKFDFKMDKQFVNFQVQCDGKLFLVNLPVKINSEEDFVFLTDCSGVSSIISDNGDLIKNNVEKKNSMERVIGLIDSYRIQNFILKNDFDFVNVFQKRIPNINDICFYPIDSKIQIRDLSTYIKIAVPYVKIKSGIYVKISSKKVDG